MTVKIGEVVWLFLERARRRPEGREWLWVLVNYLLPTHGEVIIPQVFVPPFLSFS